MGLPCEYAPPIVDAPARKRLDDARSVVRAVDGSRFASPCLAASLAMRGCRRAGEAGARIVHHGRSITLQIDGGGCTQLQNSRRLLLELFCPRSWLEAWSIREMSVGRANEDSSMHKRLSVGSGPALACDRRTPWGASPGIAGGGSGLLRHRKGPREVRQAEHTLMACRRPDAVLR
jgi:hypothetical protein